MFFPHLLRQLIIHLIAMSTDFPLPVVVVGTATLLGDLIDSTTNTRAGDMLSLVLFFLQLLGLKLIANNYNN